MLPSRGIRRGHDPETGRRERQILVDAESDSDDVGCVSLDRYVAAVAIKECERGRDCQASRNHEDQCEADRAGMAMHGKASARRILRRDRRQKS